MDEEGRVQIPKAVLDAMDIDAPANFAVSRHGDAIALYVIRGIDKASVWREIFKKFDEKNINMSEDEVLEEIQAYRKEQLQASKQEQIEHQA